MQFLRLIIRITFSGVFLYLLISGKAPAWLSFIFLFFALTVLLGSVGGAAKQKDSSSCYT